MRVLVFTLVVALGGCVVGPDFSRPPVPKVDRYTRETLPNVPLAQKSATGVPPIARPWWQIFRSADLDATVETALAGNRNLQAAQARLAQANAIYSASRSARLPAVTGQLAGGRKKMGAAALGGLKIPPFTYYSIGTEVSYLLDFSGGVHRTIEARQALAEVKAHELAATRLTLTGNVVLQALAIAAAREQIHAAEAVIADDKQNVILVQTALRAGSVARIDLLSAQSQLAQDETLLPPPRQDLSMATHALAVLVGEAPGNWSAPTFDLADFRPPATLPRTLPSELARKRPDILAAEASLHAATAAVGIAAARLYPHITLSSSLSQEALTAGDLFDHDSSAWGLAVGLTAPIFNRGKLRSQRRAANSGMQAALADYEQTVLVAFRQVANVLSALEHDSELGTAQERALEVAEANLALTRKSYAAGNVGVLQVLDAERLTERARMGVAHARALRMQDIAELVLALGGGSPEA